MNKKLTLITFAIAVAGLIRLIPHPYNLTPIGGMALAGGVYIGRKYLAFLIPFLTLFVTDLILNNTISRVFFTEQEGFVVFGDYMIYTYLAFGLTVVLGSLIKSKGLSKVIIGGSLAASILFFVITNFGTWLSAGIYPRDLGGLMACFVAAVPFFWNTLLSNVLFTALIVLGIEFALKYQTSKVVTE